MRRIGRELCALRNGPSVVVTLPPLGTVPTTRSTSRPERHFADSFITFRLALARPLVHWLPRCPLCHQGLPGFRLVLDTFQWRSLMARRARVVSPPRLPGSAPRLDQPDQGANHALEQSAELRC